MVYSIFGKRLKKRGSNSENLLKIIKSVESTHRGLGVPLSFNLLSILGNQSIFNVGSSGKGKTRMIFSLIENCKTLPRTIINNWNAMTYYELVEKIGMRTNQTLLWTVEEWSMLSDYHRELLMAIASKVQTDRTFERMVKVGSYAQQILIQDCDLILLIAIQPFKFRKLMKESDNWNSLASDRFIKFMFINPIQQDTKDFNPKFELPTMDAINLNFKPHPVLTEMFSDHLTQSRAELASLKFMNAYCKLNNMERFTDIDASIFRTLYEPYLSLFPMMIYSTDPDREDSFHTGPFRLLEYFMNHFGKTVREQELSTAFHMSQSDDMKELSRTTIYRHLSILKNRGIVQNNSPEWSLSPKYQNYFENYRSNWSK